MDEVDASCASCYQVAGGPGDEMVETLGVMLRNARARAGKTQEEVAEEMGIDRGTYIRYEGGGSYPEVRLRGSVAQWLGVDVADLPPPPEQKKAKKRTRRSGVSS